MNYNTNEVYELKTEKKEIIAEYGCHLVSI
jgi:hypothetical protein